MKFLKFLLILPVMALFIGQADSAVSKPSNKMLKIGMTQEFENLNPLIMQMLATTYIYKMVNRNLVTMNEKAEWIPQIVKQIPDFKNGGAKFITEKGVKKIVANWEIRENVQWGDGTPVTGHDVKFSWQVGMNPNISVGDKEVYSQVEEITVDPKNPKKFTFKYDKARWDYYTLGTFYIVPKHLEEKPYKKFGNQKEGYSKNSLYSKTPTNPGLYMGPYRIKEIKLGSHILLERNPKFYGKKANIENIILKLIPNTNTLESNLRSGTIDMISKLGMTFDQAMAFEKKAKKSKWPYDTRFKASAVYEHIDLNLANPTLKDLNVRKALVHAIDRDELTKALFDGRQKTALHNIAPVDSWFTDNPKEIVLYKSSKRKARKLLDKAGWKLNKKDGFRYKDGKKLSLSFMTTAGNKTRELVQVFLKDQWKAVGIDVQIKNQPARVYFGETVRKGKYPALAMYAWISSPQNVPESTLHSKNIPTEKNGFSGQNSGKWSNKKVDELLESIKTEFDAKKRKQIITKILKFYTNEVPVIPLYYRSDVSIVPENMKNYQMSPHQFSETNFVENWKLK